MYVLLFFFVIAHSLSSSYPLPPLLDSFSSLNSSPSKQLTHITCISPFSCLLGNHFKQAPSWWWQTGNHSFFVFIVLFSILFACSLWAQSGPKFECFLGDGIAGVDHHQWLSGPTWISATHVTYYSTASFLRSDRWNPCFLMAGQM